MRSLRTLALAALLGCSGCVGLDRATADAIAARALAERLATVPEPVIAERIELDAEQVLTVSVNDQPLSMLMGPGRSSTLHLRRADAAALFGPTAEQFDRRGDWPGATRATERVGPVLVRGHRAAAAVNFPFGSQIGQVEWFDQEDVVTTGQGGPFAMPAAIVHFRLRQPLSGEQSFTMPLDEEDNRWGIASTSVAAGQATLRLAFAPHLPRTVASAAAGGALARAMGGRFIGQPETVAISHGIERPARPVALDRPFAVGGLQLRTLLVRTLDYGAATGISDQIDGPENPADILVTGRADRQAPHFIVYLGADILDGCSSISFDKRAMTITLSCLPPA